MSLPINLRVPDPRAGTAGLDIGSAGLDQDWVGRHAFSGPGGQRNLVSGGIEELEGWDALEDARAGGSIAKQDRRGQLAAGEGTDPSEDGL
jgi:hypothetical protein